MSVSEDGQKWLREWARPIEAAIRAWRPRDSSRPGGAADDPSAEIFRRGTTAAVIARRPIWGVIARHRYKLRADIRTLQGMVLLGREWTKDQLYYQHEQLTIAVEEAVRGTQQEMTVSRQYAQEILGETA